MLFFLFNQREVNALRQELKSRDARYNEAQSLRTKVKSIFLSPFLMIHFQLSDEKNALMKEISRLENLTKDFERELDQVKYSKISRNNNNE